MTNVRSFDFKSVGVRYDAPKQPRPSADIPIGIKTPMRLGQGSDGIFAMHFSLGTQIRDNFRNLLLTNYGERFMLYNFGANLRELTLEVGSDIFDQELAGRINTAVGRWMPYVQLDRLEREIDNLDNENVAKINVKVFYNIPTLKLNNQLVEINFFIAA